MQSGEAGDIPLVDRLAVIELLGEPFDIALNRSLLPAERVHEDVVSGGGAVVRIPRLPLHRHRDRHRHVQLLLLRLEYALQPHARTAFDQILSIRLRLLCKCTCQWLASRLTRLDGLSQRVVARKAARGG